MTGASGSLQEHIYKVRSKLCNWLVDMKITFDSLERIRMSGLEVSNLPLDLGLVTGRFRLSYMPVTFFLLLYHGSWSEGTSRKCMYVRQTVGFGFDNPC